MIFGKNFGEQMVFLEVGRILRRYTMIPS